METSLFILQLPYKTSLDHCKLVVISLVAVYNWLQPVQTGFPGYLGTIGQMWSINSCLHLTYKAPCEKSLGHASGCKW